MNSSLTSPKAYVNQAEKDLGLAVFDFKISNGLIRYGLIALLSMLITHVRYGLFPFSTGYTFPGVLFLNIFSFGFILCTSSWIASNLFKYTLFRSGLFQFKNILKFLAVNAVVVIFVFTVLFFYRNYPRYFSPSIYLAYLMVSFAVVTIENLLFLTYAMHQAKKHEGKKCQRKALLVAAGKRSLHLDFERISHVQLEDGIIVFYTTDNQRINSQFNALDQVAQELPAEKFYRANRQFILHRNAIKYISKDKNRKLLVHINGQVPGQDIVVSRYKNREIKEWLSMKLG